MILYILIQSFSVIKSQLKNTITIFLGMTVIVVRVPKELRMEIFLLYTSKSFQHLPYLLSEFLLHRVIGYELYVQGRYILRGSWQFSSIFFIGMWKNIMQDRYLNFYFKICFHPSSFLIEAQTACCFMEEPTKASHGFQNFVTIFCRKHLF